MNRGPCEICSCPLTSRGTGKVHALCPLCGRDCRNEFAKAKNSEIKKRHTFRDSQDVTDLTPPPGNFDKAKPLGRKPFGRPAADLRNTARIESFRIDDGKEVLHPFRTAYFDIEAGGLNASFSRILTCVIYLTDPSEKFGFRADHYDSWKRGQRSDDSEMIADIFAVLEIADMWIGHNLMRYDIPMLNARAMALRLPSVVPREVVDPCMVLRRKARFASNAQGSVAQDLGLTTEKTPVDHQYWVAAVYDGSVEAMNYIYDHCVHDVEQLVEEVEVIRGWVKKLDHFGSYR